MYGCTLHGEMLNMYNESAICTCVLFCFFCSHQIDLIVRKQNHLFQQSKSKWWGRRERSIWIWIWIKQNVGNRKELFASLLERAARNKNAKNKRNKSNESVLEPMLETISLQLKINLITCRRTHTPWSISPLNRVDELFFLNGFSFVFSISFCLMCVFLSVDRMPIVFRGVSGSFTVGDYLIWFVFFPSPFCGSFVLTTPQHHMYVNC